jgi:hypothetical protein
MDSHLRRWWYSKLLLWKFPIFQVTLKFNCMSYY